MSTWKDDRKFTEAWQHAAERERENSENEAKLREELSENFVNFASEKFAQFSLTPLLSLLLFLPPPTFNSYIFVANF